uniref:NUDIX hydrolase n=1 Tax=Rhodopseudomonas palustris (strain BisA53) TaxID=316055 RepID=Q07PI7_RHOP5
MTDIAIHRVDRLELPCRPFRWAFAEQRRDEIAAYFAEKQAEKPALWNGRILLGRNASFADGCFRAEYFEAGFADFLAWRDWGFPDPTVFNGFGMGALRSNDGAFVLGEMGAHTANAGRLYFPAGTPDLDDLRDGALDIAGSVQRELLEETGIDQGDCRAAPQWDCIVAGGLIAVIRLLDIDLPGEALRQRIEANLARQAQPELSGVCLVRSAGDFTAAMPDFVVAYIARQFA